MDKEVFAKAQAINDKIKEIEDRDIAHFSASSPDSISLTLYFRNDGDHRYSEFIVSDNVAIWKHLSESSREKLKMIARSTYSLVRDVVLSDLTEKYNEMEKL